jgi:threonylcarbamoyladenosine tRNA methylthiotransferase MtaB
MNYKVAFETLGCRLNQAETASLHRSFLEKGYDIVEDASAADLCVVNTCALTSQAASKCRRKIRSIARINPDACIAAVGCYAQTDTELLKEVEGLDYIVGTADKLRLAELIPQPAKLPEPLVLTHRIPREGFKVKDSGYYPSNTRANVKIQEGCNFVCSFCIIPRSRGPARSRDFDDIIREARVLAAEGHREIILTGINLGTYDHGGKGLADLVREMSSIEELERIRLSSIEPTTIDERLFEYMTGGKLCPYLHVPLQSGDDGILGAMRRHYTSAEYVAFVERFLDKVPGAGLGTDVMVGFPGESEEAFRASLDLIERFPFTHIHVFSFSPRKGTAAYAMKNKVGSAVVRARSATMHELGERKKRQYYASQEGRLLRVLFEEKETSGCWVGFSDNYVKVGVQSAEPLANRMGLVRITGCSKGGTGESMLALGELESMEEAAAPRRVPGEAR